jgi:hypothetical protein
MKSSDGSRAIGTYAQGMILRVQLELGARCHICRGSAENRGRGATQNATGHRCQEARRLVVVCCLDDYRASAGRCEAVLVGGDVGCCQYPGTLYALRRRWKVGHDGADAVLQVSAPRRSSEAREHRLLSNGAHTWRHLGPLHSESSAFFRYSFAMFFSVSGRRGVTLWR